MSNQRFSPEFKDEAVRQIVDRGYSVAEVSERLGVSAHSLYKWVKAVKPDKTDEQAAPTVNRHRRLTSMMLISSTSSCTSNSAMIGQSAIEITSGVSS